MLRSASTVIVSLLGAWCFAQSALAQTNDPEQRDLAEIAKGKGISVVEAQRRRALEVEAGELDARLEKNSNYSGLKIISDAQGFQAIARFSGNGAAALRA